jgi:hypothetical protein
MLLRLVLGLANPVVSVIHLRMLMGIHPGRSRSMFMGCQGCILYSRDAAKGKRPGRKVGSGVILLVLRMCSTPIACVLARSTHYAVNESSPRTSPSESLRFLFLSPLCRSAELSTFISSRVLSSPTPPIAIGIATSERALCPCWIPLKNNTVDSIVAR